MTSPEFEQAKARLEASDASPDNLTKLALYGLFKQATLGDCTGKRPGMIDVVGRAKYDAWASHQGTSPADAERAYVAKVDEILGA